MKAKLKLIVNSILITAALAAATGVAFAQQGSGRGGQDRDQVRDRVDVPDRDGDRLRDRVDVPDQDRDRLRDPVSDPNQAPAQDRDRINQ